MTWGRSPHGGRPLVNSQVMDLKAQLKQAVETAAAALGAPLDVAIQETPATKPGDYGTPAAFSFPITKIVIGSGLKIASGSASGAALYFDRMNEDTGAILGLTLANFTIDYVKHQVLADTTPKGGSTLKMMPLYNFTVNTPLGLKYSFPLNITLHEQLGDLRLTDQARNVILTTMELNADIVDESLRASFGTLTQDVSTNLRKKSISSALYVAK